MNAQLEYSTPKAAEARTSADATREPERFLAPAVDIYETPEGLTVLADLPGVEKDGLTVTVERGTLTIEGRVPETAKTEAAYREFTLGSYYRQFTLGNEVDRDRITAELSNGVLRLWLPRADAHKPRQIPVVTG
jgi:HSP20 family molecular chaperone IbpA